MAKATNTTRAQESTNAIERLYITMRHLFNRGFYKPTGVSGETLKNALLLLRPEIYGSIAEEKGELKGLIYVLERLPEGIEQCRFINLTSDEGYANSHFKAIVPPKRRRNCYRIDGEQMNIEITRGRSDIYDILTHLTFLFIESEKICKKVLIEDTDETIRDWLKLEAAVNKKKIESGRTGGGPHTHGQYSWALFCRGNVGTSTIDDQRKPRTLSKNHLLAGQAGHRGGSDGQ